MRMILCVLAASVLAHDAAAGETAPASPPDEKSAPAHGDETAPDATDEKAPKADEKKTAPSPSPGQEPPLPPAGGGGGGGLIPELI